MLRRRVNDDDGFDSIDHSTCLSPIHFQWSIELTHSPYQPVHFASSAMSLYRSTTLPSIPRPGHSPYSNTHKQPLRCHQQWGTRTISHDRKTVYCVSTCVVQLHLLCNADYEADELPEWVVSEVDGILCDEDFGALSQASCMLAQGLKRMDNMIIHDYPLTSLI